MSLIKWTEEDYGTSVAACDEQHQELFNRVNALNDVIPGGERSAIGSALDSLIEYVIEHFQSEEQMMEQKGYADLEAHRKLHAELIDTCADLQGKFHANKAEVGSDTMAFIKDWLDNHIPIIDRKYGNVLKS